MRIQRILTLFMVLSLFAGLALAQGKLDITTTPEDARVYVNGKFIGLAPMLLTNVPQGMHLLEIKKDDHRDYIREVFVPEGKTLVLNVQLHRHKSEEQRKKVRIRNSLLGIAVVNELINTDSSKHDKRKDWRKGILGLGLINELLNK